MIMVHNWGTMGPDYMTMLALKKTIDYFRPGALTFMV